jgi:hypothetical protein
VPLRRSWLTSRLFWVRECCGHDGVSQRVQVRIFASTWKANTKRIPTYGTYISITKSLCFLYAVWDPCVVNANSKIGSVGLKKLIPTHMNR